MTAHQRAIADFDRAIAEHEAREFAESIGYSFAVMTDGTIVLEPPADPTLAADGDHCADCRVKLTALDRCQIPELVNGGPAFRIVFYCPDHYRARTA